YEAFDFTADTDDAPNPATSGPDGLVRTRSYRAGPFVIRDPVPATTTYNEAWDHISALRTLKGYNPLIHEIRSSPSGPRLNAGFLTFMPRISYSNNAGISDDEILLAKLPAIEVRAPGTTTAPSTVAGGGLFEGDPADPCGLQPRYDIFIQDHYDWDTPNANERAAMQQFDRFLRAGTTCIFECLSATVENTLFWLTLPPNVATEGVTTAASYTVVRDFADHPFAQTMGPVPIRGGAFQLWDDTRNRFRTTSQNIFYDAGSLDMGYMLGQVDGGKFFFAGGHQRGSVVDRRIILNAILYEVVSPQFAHEFFPGRFRAGVTERKEVRVTIRGGSLALGTRIVDVLQPIATFVPGSVTVNVPGGTHSWDAGTRTLTFTLGNVDPMRFVTTPVARYEVDVLIPTDGFARILDSTITYGDAWTTGISFTGGSCRSVRAAPRIEATKRADKDVLLVGANAVVLSITVTNNGDDALRDVILTDMLPAGVTYVGPLDTHGRGTADWNITTPATLTWRVGWLLPGESATIEMPVTASPSAVGTFLLNDGARAVGTPAGGGPAVSHTSADLRVAVVTGGPNLRFTLVPDSTAPSATVAFTLTIRNDGARTDQQGGDVVEIDVPAGWGEPTAIVPPAGWTYIWDRLNRRLTFSHPGTTVRWDVGASFVFGFTSIAPPAAGTHLFHSRVTFNVVPRDFDADLPVAVRYGTGIDSDGDGISDDDEIRIGTNPNNADTDGDGISDGQEVGNPAAPRDSDGDGIIDALDTDSDNDGIPDLEEGLGDPDGDGIPNYRDTDSDGDGLGDREERAAGTNPYNADSDGDCVPDGLEPEWNRDTDGDGLINALDPDSDNDALADGLELGLCGDADPSTITDPLDPDTDGDGLDDSAEDLNLNGRVDPFETDPNRGDTDGGGTLDGREIADGTDPLDPFDDLDADPDADGLSTRVERLWGTDPLDPDTDGDGIPDGREPRWNTDTDGDGLINALDIDSDNDGCPDGNEDANRNGVVDPGETDPLLPGDCPPVGADADADADADPDADLDAEPDAEPDADEDADPDADLDAEPDAEPDVDVDVDPDAEPDVDPDADPDADSDDVAADGDAPDAGREDAEATTDTGGEADDPDAADVPPAVGAGGGCGCRTAARPSGIAWAALLALGFLVTRRRDTRNDVSQLQRRIPDLLRCDLGGPHMGRAGDRLQQRRVSDRRYWRDPLLPQSGVDGVVRPEMPGTAVPSGPRRAAGGSSPPERSTVSPGSFKRSIRPLRRALACRRWGIPRSCRSPHRHAPAGLPPRERAWRERVVPASTSCRAGGSSLGLLRSPTRPSDRGSAGGRDGDR
ncbi:MAG: MYXO-CTERM sorting domain-containing protein, partial [Myxococcota bacterium]|nr:MYXO-CTERM sorting domain-containing protein [Myxococcota bacterium]